MTGKNVLDSHRHPRPQTLSQMLQIATRCEDRERRATRQVRRRYQRQRCYFDGEQSANERNKKRGADMRRVHWFCMRTKRRANEPNYTLLASIACCNRDFGCTPTNRSTTSPFLKIMSVGMLLTP